MNINYHLLVKLTNEQFNYNDFKNIFCLKTNFLHFNEELKQFIITNRNIFKLIELGVIEQLITYLTDEFITRFYQTNQYINFTNDQVQEIRDIYKMLFEELSDEKMLLTNIENNHYQRIKMFIIKSNPGIYKINDSFNMYAKSFICKEYSSRFQVELFKFDISKIKEPILDIGCGKKGNLVNHF